MADNVLSQWMLEQAKRRQAAAPPTEEDARQRQEMLRRQMMQEDPAHFRSLQQRGYDPLAQGERPPIEAAFAQPGFAMLNDPAAISAPYTVQAVSQPIDLDRQRYADLIARSRASERGRSQFLQNIAGNTELQKRIARLQNSFMPADYGDADNSYKKRLLQMLLSMTGQGGGMRP